MLRSLRALGSALLVALSACSGGGSSDGGIACAGERHVGPGDAACATGRGGPMRQIPLPAGGTMCIDETEVTAGQYQAFLAAKDQPQVPASDPAYMRCSAKTSHAPINCMAEPCSGASCDLPQTCVDQCDAKVYCAWAGKRLCGGIGGAPLALADFGDPTRSQWMNACTSGGRAWPYGPTYDGQACNTSDRKPTACGGVAVTSSFPGCEAPAGPYDQVFDLSGNASEWTDSSDEAHPGWPACVVMGGSFVHYWGDVSCTGSMLQWPCDAHIDEFGFRCCSL